MERLTYWCDNGHGGGKWFVAIDAEGGEDYGPHVDRLAAYEETGLEPGEIEQLIVLSAPLTASANWTKRTRKIGYCPREVAGLLHVAGRS